MTALHQVKQTTLMERAISTLNVFRQVKDLNEILEKDKAYFRDEAQGETTDIIVPSIGKIQVKKPSEGGLSTSTILNLKKWESLDKATQHELIKQGLIEVKTTSRAPSLAAVVITLNV